MFLIKKMIITLRYSKLKRKLFRCVFRTLSNIYDDFYFLFFCKNGYWLWLRKKCLNTEFFLVRIYELEKNSVSGHFSRSVWAVNSFWKRALSQMFGRILNKPISFESKQKLTNVTAQKSFSIKISSVK